VALGLSAANASLSDVPVEPAAGSAAPEASDTSFLLARWQESVVAVWAPTARATAFLIDQRGLLATSAHAVGRSSQVDVQLSDTLAVAAQVVARDPGGAAAILRVHPDVVAGRAPIPLDCAPASRPALGDGEEVTTLVSSVRRATDQTWGEVTLLTPRGIETDLRVPFGGEGGPVFNAKGVVAGLTWLRDDDAGMRARDVLVVRAGIVCDALAAATAALAATPPDAAPVPVDPGRAFPVSSDAAVSDTPPPTVSSSGFDVAFITPPMVVGAQQRADRTGGATGRSPEAEAVLGRLTDFGDRSGYFADVPAVLVGEKLAGKIPMKLVHSIAAAIFALLGVATLLGAGSGLGF